ncbi:hypothetical protein L228DRAFT_248175 [Xylona heveae TC161]|uniref:Uncharacterized protein n=1 Tax=Xylona heveae (strain CBS 132557 / TC161) TaxID=1328760 RepID=A0A165FWF4_XYLHT|nr:hypothetical protein L228DRAFT_248175 [Xylona heveae TC161]KZF21463.1 hypothetical protein L228DRAFT_248175 [Xylona heveae TC161]
MLFVFQSDYSLGNGRSWDADTVLHCAGDDDLIRLNRSSYHSPTATPNERSKKRVLKGPISPVPRG